MTHVSRFIHIMVEHKILAGEIYLKITRNLSYTEESYLDNFSTCANFVKAPSNRRYCWSCPQLTDMDIGLGKDGDCSTSVENTKFGCDMNGQVQDMPETHGRKVELLEVASEEGVFVNMMDDLDSVGSPQSVDSVDSDVSYFSLDSINSPEESSRNQEFDNKTQLALTEQISKGLQKADLRKISSESSIDTENGGKSSAMKKTPSDGNFQTKIATLNIAIKDNLFANADSFHKYLLEVPTSPECDDSEFNIDKAQLRKSSSLKSTKSPPGTPRRKKMVRFADAFGLDLESVRHVLNTEHPPRIPASAMKDLKTGVEEDRRQVGSRYLDLCFPQPGASQGFLEKVMANKVALESCIISDISITGIVRVANIGYHKSVRIRYSINDWVTFYDIMASYVQSSCDGPTDRFSFTVVAPASVGPGSKLSFAASYTVNDTIYWDSNGGKNYDVVCFAKTTPTELEPSWVHFV